MCAYSWVKTYSSQSSVLPMVDAPLGRHRVDDDGVPRDDGGRSVGQIGLIDQDHVGHARVRQGPRRRQPHVRGLGNRRQPRRQRVFAPVVVDLEMRRAMGEKPQGRVVGPCQHGAAEHQHGDQRPAGRAHGASGCGDTRVTPRRNRKSAAGDNRRPARSRRATATLVLYQRLRYGTSWLMSRCASANSARRSRVVVGDRRLVDQRIHRRVAEEPAVEAARRHLLAVEDAAQHVGVGHADPLQREELEVALQDVRVQRRELVRPDVERHADAREVLLQHRRLQAVELGARDLQRQVQPWRRVQGRPDRDTPPRRAARRPVPDRSGSPAHPAVNAHDIGGRMPTAGRASPRRRCVTMASRSTAYASACRTRTSLQDRVAQVEPTYA